MMFGTAGRYLSALLLKRFLLTALGLSALLVLFDVLNNSDQIEKRYGEGLIQIARYMTLRWPEMIGLVTPFSILVAALLGLLGLTAQNEALAFKAAGLSFYGMLGMMLPSALLIAGFHFAIVDLATPHAKRQLARLELERPTDDEAGGRRGKQQAKWLRDGQVLIQVLEVQREGRFLNHVTLYRRDAQGNLIERTSAKSARYRARQWTLNDVTVQKLDIQGPVISHAATSAWATTLRPADFFTLAANSTQFSARELKGLADANHIGTRPAHIYETWYHRRTAIPVIAIMMLLMAAPVAQARVRGANLGIRLAAGIGLGFLYFVVDGVALAMGESGAILPLISAWAPILTFGSISASVLLWIEGL